MKLTRIALAVATLSVSAGAMAHGYIYAPAERAALCKTNNQFVTDMPGINDNCGNATWEAQSTGEGPDGYPSATGPKDGQLASGGNIPLAGNLDTQTADRWVKHKVQAGPMNFSWHFTAPHRTTDIQYYITKRDWNPNLPLSRASFEDKPFCTWTNGTTVVNPQETMKCELPEREGYQVIFAKWDVNDTTASFHKVIDVMYEDGIVSEWINVVGSISPSQDLAAGSKVKARFFDASGERTDLEIALIINTDADGKKNLWSKALAEKINTSQSDIRAGQKNNKGEVIATEGLNAIYTRDGGKITRVIIEEQAAKSERFAEVTGVVESYTTKNGIVAMPVKARGDSDAVIKVSMYDSNNKPVHVVTGLLVFTESQEYGIDIVADIPNPGKHTLKMVATNSDGKEQEQTFVVDLKAPGSDDKVDFIFPQGKGTYKGATLVKQEKDGKVYECKSDMVAPWCNSASDLYYEPGVGLAWQKAWIQK